MMMDLGINGAIWSRHTTSRTTRTLKRTSALYTRSSITRTLKRTSSFIQFQRAMSSMPTIFRNVVSVVWQRARFQLFQNCWLDRLRCEPNVDYVIVDTQIVDRWCLHSILSKEQKYRTWFYEISVNISLDFLIVISFDNTEKSRKWSK